MGGSISRSGPSPSHNFLHQSSFRHSDGQYGVVLAGGSAEVVLEPEMMGCVVEVVGDGEGTGTMIPLDVVEAAMLLEMARG